MISEEEGPLPAFRQALLHSPMSSVQTWAIVALVAMCALDGVDIFSITFAAPMIGAQLAIGKAAIGLVFSSALVGMAVGSLLLSPLSDIYGRRNLLVLSLSLMVVGTLWTALARGLDALVVSRLLTGLGIGTMVAVNNPLAAEYANAARRDLCVSALNLGYPAGGIIGGLLAAWLLPTVGWRALFFVASGLGLVMLLLVLVWLPEPIVGILARPNTATLVKLNHFLRRCGQAPVDALPVAEPRNPAGALGMVLGAGALGATLFTTTIYFLFLISIYYIQSWIPSLIVAAGYSPSKAALASTAMNVSGVGGGTLLTLLVPRFGLKPVVVFGIALTALSILSFGFVPPDLALLVTIAVVVGVGTIGGMSNLYAILSRSFPAEARASGTGFVIGVGRFGSAIGPGLAGILFSEGWGRGGTSLIMALPALAAAILVLIRRARDFA